MQIQSAVSTAAAAVVVVIPCEGYISHGGVRGGYRRYPKTTAQTYRPLPLLPLCHRPQKTRQRSFSVRPLRRWPPPPRMPTAALQRTNAPPHWSVWNEGSPWTSVRQPLPQKFTSRLRHLGHLSCLVPKALKKTRVPMTRRYVRSSGASTQPNPETLNPSPQFFNRCTTTTTKWPSE